jgi:hypothetical protein
MWWHPVHAQDAGHIWLRQKAAEVGATLAGNGNGNGKGPGKSPGKSPGKAVPPVDQGTGSAPGRL